MRRILVVAAALVGAGVLVRAVAEAREQWFVRRFRRSPLLHALRVDARWRRFKLVQAGHPEPGEAEIARYITGDLDEEAADLVREWASLCPRVWRRILEMRRAYDRARST